MRNSIYDVAKRAGVSTSTVSRIINNYGGVKESKVKAVKEALEYFDYQPSQFGRGLVKRTSGMIGVYSPFLGTTMFNDGYMIECLRGIDKVISKSNYSLLLINEVEEYYKSNSSKPKFWDYVNQSRIDGLIVLNVPSDDRLESALSAVLDSDFAVGYIGQKFHEAGLNVYAQYQEYMFDMMEQYYFNGHRKILFLADRYHLKAINKIKSSIESKYNDFSLELFFADLHSQDINILIDILDKYITKEKCSGIICGTVDNAIKVVSTLNTMNINVPEDVSLIAVEHKKGEGALMLPQINCYYVPAMEMGESIAIKLIEKLQGNQIEAASKNFKTQYIERESVRRLSVK